MEVDEDGRDSVCRCIGLQQILKRGAIDCMRTGFSTGKLTSYREMYTKETWAKA